MREVQRLHMDINIKYPEFALICWNIVIPRIGSSQSETNKAFFSKQDCFSQRDMY